MPESKEVPREKKKKEKRGKEREKGKKKAREEKKEEGRDGGRKEGTERAPSARSWNNVKNTINKIVPDYKSKYKINIYESILTQMND